MPAKDNRSRYRQQTTAHSAGRYDQRQRRTRDWSLDYSDNGNGRGGRSDHRHRNELKRYRRHSRERIDKEGDNFYGSLHKHGMHRDGRYQQSSLGADRQPPNRSDSESSNDYTWRREGSCNRTHRRRGKRPERTDRGGKQTTGYGVGSFEENEDYRRVVLDAKAASAGSEHGTLRGGSAGGQEAPFSFPTAHHTQLLAFLDGTDRTRPTKAHISWRSSAKQVDRCAHGRRSENEGGSEESLCMSLRAGILPDVEPPPGLVRMALYGVDLSVTPSHMSSLLEQLLGCTPWRVRRPAQEIVAITREQRLKNAKAQETEHATASDGESPQFPHAPAPQADGSNTALSSSEFPSTGTPLTLVEELAAAGKVTEGYLDSCHPTSAIHGDRAAAPNSIFPGLAPSKVASGVLSTPSSCTFFLPGLFDVNGPGGMMVLEWRSSEEAATAVRMLNGAYLNGRPVVASI